MLSPRLRAQAGSRWACRERLRPIRGGGCSYPLFSREGALPEIQSFLERCSRKHALLRGRPGLSPHPPEDEVRQEAHGGHHEQGRGRQVLPSAKATTERINAAIADR